MSYIEKLIPLFILAATFTFGLICINNPFVVARVIVLWLKFASGSSFDEYKNNNPQIKEVFELIDHPDVYMGRSSNQIQTIRRTGYIAILVTMIGICLFLLGG